jgi:hypothetical protein
MMYSVLLVALLLSSITTAKAVPLCLFSGYCRTTADCVPGSVCSVQPNGFYSQCIEDSSCTLTKYGQPCTGILNLYSLKNYFNLKFIFSTLSAFLY